MQLSLTIAIAIGVLWFAERSLAHIALAAASLFSIAALLLLVVGDLERAILLSCIVVLGIVAASEVKYRHSGLKLIITDLPLLLAGTVRFFFVQYKLAVAAVIGGCILLFAAALVTLHAMSGPPLAAGWRLSLLVIAAASLAIGYRISG